MFDYSILHWTTFATAVVLLNLTPGTDTAFMLGQTVRGGKKAGFAALFGLWVGTFVHVVMAAAGLSAILVTSATAFTLVKWIGAIYLVWLGVTVILSKGSALIGDTAESNIDHRSIFRQGILICALNPKVAIFFLAFLPQFVAEGAGPTWAQLGLHGMLIIAIFAIVESPLIVFGDKLVGRFRDSDNVATWLNRGLGALFVSFGIKLAVSER